MYISISTEVQLRNLSIYNSIYILRSITNLTYPSHSAPAHLLYK